MLLTSIVFIYLQVIVIPRFVRLYEEIIHADYFPYRRTNRGITSFTTLVSVDIVQHEIQSTLVISKSKGPSEILPDIRTSTYQICRIEANTNRTTKFHKWTCNLIPLVRNIYWKYCGNGEKLLLRSNFSAYPQYFVTWC